MTILFVPLLPEKIVEPSGSQLLAMKNDQVEKVHGCLLLPRPLGRCEGNQGGFRI
jgi:hypothetical protein